MLILECVSVFAEWHLLVCFVACDTEPCCLRDQAPGILRIKTGLKFSRCSCTRWPGGCDRHRSPGAARGAGSDSEQAGPRDVCARGVCSCGPGRKNPGGARKDPGGDGGMVAALAQTKQEVVLLQLSCLRPSKEIRLLLKIHSHFSKCLIVYFHRTTLKKWLW